MTVSIGVAPMRYEKNANTQDVSEKLLDEADKSLYVAKESGRNQVQLAEQ